MTNDEIIEGLKFTMDMCLFSPVDGSKRPISMLNDMDKITYNACEGAIQALEAQPCEDMRDATEEERKSTKDYIDSISKPTGLQFDDIYEELDFVQPHKKTSVNLQPCEDCISRDAAKKSIQRKIDEVVSEDGSYDYDMKQYIKGLITAKIAINRCNLPSVQPQPKRGKWILTHPLQEDDSGAYMCSCCNVGNWGIDPKVDKYCFNCGADMREGEQSDG